MGLVSRSVYISLIPGKVFSASERCSSVIRPTTPSYYTSFMPENFTPADREWTGDLT